MLNVGITYNPTTPLFYSGANQTAIHLSELFSKLNCHVTFVDYTNSDIKWWDYQETQHATKNLYQVSGLDCLIDIDGVVSAESRLTAAKKTVVFLRTFLQFAEMDSTVYIETPYVLRTMQNVQEVWCWDILNPAETLPSIQTLFPCPIKTVPFIWTPSVAQHFYKSTTSDTNAQPWTVHVAEKNTDNTSSSVLPLVAIRELVHKKVIDATYKIHNADKIKENRFFKENVLVNIEIDKLPIEIVDKVPFYEWTSKDILFSHSRFTYLRMGLLNAVWMGLPLIHNSPIIRDLHPMLKEMFYLGNNVSGMCAAFSAFVSHSDQFYSAKKDIQQAMVHTFGVDTHLDKWSALFKQTIMTTIIPTFTPIPVMKPANTYDTWSKGSTLIVAFSDMWPGFNYDVNFVTDALRNALRNALHTTLRNKEIMLKGIPYDASITPNLLICGPYSESWKTIPNTIPKVFFTAENWTTPDDPAISLYLTASKTEDEKHMRIPTWMTFIDWFSEKTVLPDGCEDNPIRLPVHFAMNPHPRSFESRNQFCGFVVSNGICTFRNEAFHAINNYKRVDSGGALFNNIGGQLSLKYPGGGCGDISKHHFFAEHQFTISFENSQAPGYITEKVLHAKMAGCVPLYWGDANTDSDFVPNSIINVSNVTNPSVLVDIMKKLESNPAMCAKIAATPILDQERKQKALDIISAIALKMLSFATEPLVLQVSQQVTQQVTQIKGVEATYVINLDTRPDRWDKLIKAEPYLAPLVTRISGVNGKTLQLTQEIYNMFDKNEFQWKKSIIGCNLSHISVWKKIAESTTTTNKKYFLVLEDDVRFTKEWLTKWEAYVDHIPEDADLLYLGGVLPPNKPVLPAATEQVNPFWSKIKPNTFFSPVPIPVFHFCAYSYILTKAGAQKLMSHLLHSDKKSFTVSDHLLGHPSVGLVKYFTNPLLSYCFQEEDPVYNQSQFNDLHREDKFDSDIWNNKDCFSQEDLKPFIKQDKTMDVYYMPMDDTKMNPYERVWLEDIFGSSIVFKSLLPETPIMPDTWFLVQRPQSDTWNHMLTNLQQLNIPFKVIHLSDEFGLDNITFYQHSNCKAVVRNYLRPDLPILPHIVTIPLGYHHKALTANKTLKERDLVWSFHGTDWFQRSQQLQQFSNCVPHSCHLQPEWNHPTATKENHYLSLLGNSKFCPILRGNNDETFRLYECLEAGTLPVTLITDTLYLNWVDSHLHLSSLYEWTNPLLIMQRNTITEEIRVEVMRRWTNWKQTIKSVCQSFL